MPAMPARHRPVTSNDVARLAGVSRATVSYVLNGVTHRMISPATVERVRDAAHQLGYVPHSMARSLRAGRSDLVLIAQPAIPPSVVLDTLMLEMAHRLRELGYTVVIHADPTASGLSGARAWAALRPAGLIVQTSRLSAPAVEALQRAGTAILGWGWHPYELVPTLVNDHSHIGECAAEYLVQRGHRRIGVVVPRSEDLLQIGLERYSGVERVARAQNVELERIDLAFDETDVNRLASRWRSQQHPSGVFAYNDEFAMLFMRGLQDAGLAIPEDVAVVGADDLPLCTFLRPRLTSVHFELSRSGHAFAETLHRMINGEDPELDSVDLLQSRVVARDSA